MNNWNYQIDNYININIDTPINYISPKNQFYSQYNQDRSLENNIFKGFKNGFFMDIGAHDGVTINNTIYFETNHNWTGINVEPIKNVYDRLLTNRPNCINLNCAVSNFNGETQFLNNNGYTEMLSGIFSEYDIRHLNRISTENIIHNSYSNLININVKTIEFICEEYNINHIHYLSIDVEGGEFKVLQSINFDKVFIDVIGFENNYPDIQYIPINYLKDKGYINLPYHNGDIFMIHRNSIFLDNCRNLIR